MRKIRRLRDLAFGAAVAAALGFGAEAALAAGRGAELNEYCFAASSRSACIATCAANDDLYRSYSLGQCCCFQEK